MAQCAVADANNGVLILTKIPVDQCTGVLVLSPADYQAYAAQIAPFDYVAAAGLWSLAFTTVVGLYLVSHSIGLILGMIRR
jgi:hypothetical protein